MKQALYAVCALAIGVVGFFFYLRNDVSVSLDYFFARLDIKLPLLLVLVLALGVVIGYLCSLPRILSMRRHNAGLKKRNDLATREIANLRALPMRDAS